MKYFENKVVVSKICSIFVAFCFKTFNPYSQYYESINRVCELAKKYNVPLLLPAMGERKRLP